ncbi:MAG: TetR family transcriptional regulator [Isosphaeraceae bacterium]|nr:MAG: TetR family transcriptional regulator [Isosphaeraceae bacterium]
MPVVGSGATDPVASEELAPIARHIAREAARLFAARGYDATSVREIVEAAGVTKPTMYYYFGSKEGLAEALVTAPLDGLCDRMRSILDREGEPRRMLARLIEANFEFVRQDPDRGRFIYGLFFGPLGSGLASELARFAERIEALWDEAMGRFVAAGLIDRSRVRGAVAALRGLVIVHTIEFLYRGTELGPGLPARLVADLLEGFARREAHR